MSNTNRINIFDEEKMISTKATLQGFVTESTPENVVLVANISFQLPAGVSANPGDFLTANLAWSPAQQWMASNVDVFAGKATTESPKIDTQCNAVHPIVANGNMQTKSQEVRSDEPVNPKVESGMPLRRLLTTPAAEIAQNGGPSHVAQKAVTPVVPLKPTSSPADASAASKKPATANRFASLVGKSKPATSPSSCNVARVQPAGRPAFDPSSKYEIRDEDIPF